MAENEIRLYGTVGGSSFWEEDYFTASQVREMLDGHSGPLTVRINSGGGYAHEGQAIYTMLRDYAAEKGEVHVVVDAVAMSAASLIAMAGDTRTMRLGSYMLIHDPATPYTNGRGTEADHEQVATQLRVASKAYAEVYAARAGISADEARRIMREETILDGEAAVLMGFATATEAAEAVPAATFDYRIYAHAPDALREASRSLGAPKGQEAVMAMMAGKPRTTPKEAPMADKSKAAEGDSVDTKDKPDPKEAPAPERKVDPHAPPEGPEQVTARAVAAERARARRITEATASAGLPMAFGADLVDKGVSLETALDRITAKWAEQGDKDVPMHGAPTARVGVEASEKFFGGIEKALMAKIGIKGGERNEFTSMSLAEMARASLDVTGRRIKPGASRLEMVGAALTMVGQHTTSDFGTILGNTARKSLIRGFEEAPENFGFLVGTPLPLTDFKPVTQVGMGFFENLAEVPEGAEFKYGTFGERSQAIALLTYGKLFAITRQAIINDDLTILSEVPRKMGRAAKRTVGNLVWNVVLANAGLGVVLADGQTLFHASHGNVAASGAALSVDSLGAAIAAMMVQKADGLTVGIKPRYLIVPAALQFKAREIVNSAVYPGANRGMQANPVAGSVEVVVDARLDAVSTTAWYLAADPADADTIRLAYLDGNEEPFMDERENWHSDGREWKVRMDAGVAPGDFRAFYRNAGA